MLFLSFDTKISLDFIQFSNILVKLSHKTQTFNALGCNLGGGLRIIVFKLFGQGYNPSTSCVCIYTIKVKKRFGAKKNNK